MMRESAENTVIKMLDKLRRTEVRFDSRIVAVLMRKMGVRLSTGVLAGTVTAKEQEIFGGMAMTMLDGMQMTTHQCCKNTGVHRRRLCTGVRWRTKR